MQEQCTNQYLEIEGWRQRWSKMKHWVQHLAASLKDIEIRTVGEKVTRK